jgi:hypothetical protein
MLPEPEPPRSPSPVVGSSSSPEGPPPPAPAAERAFPIVMRYSGLLLAMYEGLIDRPPQPLVIGLAALMMAGAQVVERVVGQRG